MEEEGRGGAGTGWGWNFGNGCRPQPRGYFSGFWTEGMTTPLSEALGLASYGCGCLRRECREDGDDDDDDDAYSFRFENATWMCNRVWMYEERGIARCRISRIGRRSSHPRKSNYFHKNVNQEKSNQPIAFVKPFPF
jgi:hypothetical protein